MKNVKNQDERVINERRKIQSDGYQLLVYALLISIVIQQFFMQGPPSQYMAEFLCLIGAGIYNLVRNIKIGNNLYGERHDSGKKLFKNYLIVGLFSTLIFAVLTGEKNIGYLINFYLVFAVGCGGLNYLLYYISKRKQEKIEEELNFDEDNIE